MVDTILENYSKAVESTLSLQQEMLRNWTTQRLPFGAQVSGLPLTATSTSVGATTAAPWLEQLSRAQRLSAEAVMTDMLKRHQETLSEFYRAGIQAIGDSFRLGEARDPEQFRCLSEELWRRNCEVVKTAVASQIHDVQSVMDKWYEAASRGAGGMKM